MDKHYTYLLINFLTIFFPLVLSFDKRVRFYSSWKFITPGLLFTGLLFLVWDHIFTVYKVWSFNSRYILGIYIFDLPLEEILFFLTVPFACLFIYECLNYYLKTNIPRSLAVGVSASLLILSAAMLLMFSDRLYTLVTFSLLLLLCLLLLYLKPVFLGKFFLAFVVSLLPFYVVNGFLTALPVVLYNDAGNSGIRVGTIPLEDHFYSLSLLMLNVLFFEYFRGRKL